MSSESKRLKTIFQGRDHESFLVWTFLRDGSNERLKPKGVDSLLEKDHEKGGV